MKGPILILVIFLLLFTTNCSNNDIDLIGTWQEDDSQKMALVYEFNKDRSFRFSWSENNTIFNSDSTKTHISPFKKSPSQLLSRNKKKDISKGKWKRKGDIIEISGSLLFPDKKYKIIEITKEKLVLRNVSINNSNITKDISFVKVNQ